MNRILVGGGVILLLLVGAVVGLGLGMPAATIGPVQTVQVNVPKPASSDRTWAVELDPGGRRSRSARTRQGW